MSAKTFTVAAQAPSTLTADAGFTMLAKLLYLVSRVGLPPLVLAHVTLSQYGIWSACFVLVGYIGLADLGFSSVYVRSAARLHAAGDTAGIGRLLSTGVLFMLALASLLFAAVALSLPALMDLVRIAPAERATARVLILGCVAVFLLDMSLNAFAYVLHGLQRLRAEQQVWVLAFTLELGLIAAFLYAGLGIYALPLAFGLRYGFSIACNVWQAYRALPGLSFGPRHFDRSLLPHFFSFGLSVQASTLFAMALHSADRLISGALLGPQAMALFDLGSKLPVSASSVPAAISRATLPAASRYVLDAGDEPLRRLHAQGTRAVSLIAAVPLGFLAAFASPISQAWLGTRPELALVALLMALAAVTAYLHILTGPGSSVFRGAGRIGNEFVYHGLRVAFIGVGLVLACGVGGVSVESIASGLAGGGAAAALVYLCLNHRRFGLPLNDLLARVLLPGLSLFAIAGALALVWQLVLPAELGRWETLAVLGCFGAMNCALAAVLIWLQLDQEEKAHLAALGGRLGARLRLWRTA